MTNHSRQFLDPQEHLNDKGTRGEKARGSYIYRKYGLKLEDFDAIWRAQGGKCPICGRDLKTVRVEIDHRHVPKYKSLLPNEKRKYVRGLTCGGRYKGCNRRLGRIDDPQWLRQAANYVEDPPAQKVLNIGVE